MTSRGFTILAIDPGLTGAFAFYAPAAPDHITVDDMPVVGSHVDPAALARRIRQLAPNVAIVERVAARPGQGVSSMFKFGTGYGMVQGVIAALGIPVILVTPASWKRHFRLPADKEAARARAIQLWPTCDRFSLKKHSGRAEAALIARYATEVLFDTRSATPATDCGVAGAGGGPAVVGTDTTTSSPRAPEVPA